MTCEAPVFLESLGELLCAFQSNPFAWVASAAVILVGLGALIAMLRR
jgi:hypothetical protein